MSKSKGLRTYSKTKKLINQSELLFSELTSNHKVEHKTKDILVDTDKNQNIEDKKETNKSVDMPPVKAVTVTAKETENQENNANLEAETQKRSLRTRRVVSAGNLKTAKSTTTTAASSTATQPTGKTTRKRKNTHDKDTKKEDEEEVEQTEKQSSTNKRNSNQRVPKLFETTDTQVEDEDQVEAKPKTTRNSKKTNIKVNKNESNENGCNVSESATATAIINSALSCGTSIEENRAPPKSIIKSKKITTDDADSKENDEPKVAKVKRGVRILEEINEKNDQILNVRCNNRTKHTASTSTPSGVRRKPLKAPQDVSMICKPENEQSVGQ